MVEKLVVVAIIFLLLPVACVVRCHDAMLPATAHRCLFCQLFYVISSWNDALKFAVRSLWCFDLHSVQFARNISKYAVAPNVKWKCVAMTKHINTFNKYTNSNSWNFISTDRERQWERERDKWRERMRMRYLMTPNVVLHFCSIHAKVKLFLALPLIQRIYFKCELCT